MYNLFRRTNSLPRQVCKCSTESKQPPPQISQKKTELVAQKTETNIEEKPKKSYDISAVTKDDLQWRTPWHQVEGQYFSALRAMSSEDNQLRFTKLITSRPDLSLDGIKKWWINRREEREAIMQSYLPERNQILGNELAAAHFLVHRGGAVKFYGQKNWIKCDDRGNYKLPRKYQAEMILEAIDCSDLKLYYEGLANFRGLRDVKWLSFNGVEMFDDWYIDKISNMFSHSLVYLDIRNCPNLTYRGIGALYKMPKLKILCIDNMLLTTNIEMTCLLLQELNPALDIRMGNVEYFNPETTT